MARLLHGPCDTKGLTEPSGRLCGSNCARARLPAALSRREIARSGSRHEANQPGRSCRRARHTVTPGSRPPCGPHRRVPCARRPSRRQTWIETDGTSRSSLIRNLDHVPLHDKPSREGDACSREGAGVVRGNEVQPRDSVTGLETPGESPGRRCRLAGVGGSRGFRGLQSRLRRAAVCYGILSTVSVVDSSLLERVSVRVSVRVESPSTFRMASGVSAE